MSVYRMVADLFARGERVDSAGSQSPDAREWSLLALPSFLDVSKTLTLTHAEISALYFVVEDYFEAEIEGADPEDPVDEARTLAWLLRDVIRRWNAAEPAGIYADLIELPWNT